MSHGPLSRRTFAGTLAAAMTPGILGVTRQAGTEGVTHDAEAIHQEIAIGAASHRVYELLTDAAKFSTLFKYGTVPTAPPAQIDRRAGGAFVLFDGHITGLTLELVPNQRLVQAWRAADWQPGLFSVVRVDLRAQGRGTLIVFDHTGFPNGQGAHLASGWHANYWNPMKKVLGG